MGSKRLQALRAEHDHVRSAMDTIENAAVDAGRDITDEEQEQLDALKVRATAASTRIEQVNADYENRRATDEILANLPVDDDPAALLRSGVTRVAEAPRMTAGEYASLFLRAHSAERDQDAMRLLELEHVRVLDTQSTSEVTGIIPTPIIGDLIKFVDATRPVVNSMRELPMPQAGSAFTRPRVTQTTTAAIQSAQHDVLSSRNMTITGDAVTKGTYGGTLSLSEQVIDWSDPALLQIVIEDMAEQYAIETESVASAAIESGVTTNVEDLSLTADSDAFYAGLGAAAAGVYGTAKVLPDTLYAAIDRWAFLLSLMDETGRPLFPTLSPQNAGGTLEVTSFNGNPLGLRLVVGAGFTAGFFALGASRYLEKFEQNKGLAQVSAPANLSYTVAYRGYFATNVRPQGLVGLAPASS